ncbi:MAG: FmdB family zinc ribbon protein [Acidobacteriota bacterium]
MPYFDFQCEKCEHKFELRISNEEKSKVKCPECGHKKVKQLLSPFFSTSGRSSAPARVNLSDSCKGCGQAGMG